ncbi:ataxin-7-like protein 3 [Gadus macrocephalus]|uniref:ataxin-7-like protein 3 n=1 Tax=Gadus macrocephalus TaxID=80720 RepID=UPI0028CB7E3D|nr:ataxin-7-like protein 3 [Gadus macrocephalus]XP_059926452.1 ataxin-7-like protein 3 [Gadus macrocephalus]
MKMEEKSLSGLNDTKLEALVDEIYCDLVEDACLGLSFEVHRAVKQGHFFLDDTDQESMKEFEIVDQPGVDVFGQVYNQWKNKECECPNCKRCIAASRFAPHLEKCLGMGRNSSRIANRRLANNNNLNKSESDQEDNDDLNDNDWSYGAEKKAKKRKGEKLQNSPRRSKSVKHKNGELSGSTNAEPYKYSYSVGINYETLGPQELRSLLTTQCGVISEHTKKMCTRSQRCPQHTDQQRRTVRVFLLGPSGLPSLASVDAVAGGNGYDVAGGGQALMSRLQWEDSSENSVSSNSSGPNPTDPRRPKKKRPSSTAYGGGGGGGGGMGDPAAAQRGGGGGPTGAGGSGSASASSSSASGTSQGNLGFSNKNKRPKQLPTASMASLYDEFN